MKKFVTILLLSWFYTGVVWGQCSNPYAGDDVDVCGCTVSLNVENATTGSWAAYFEGSPVSVSYLPDNTATSVDVTVDDFVEPLLELDFVWTDDSGPCTDTVVVSFYRKPQPFAGLDDAVCGNNYQLEGSYEITESAGYTPTGVWSVYNHPAGAAANINQMNNDTAQVTVSQVGIWNYVIRENNSLLASCYSTDTVQIEFVETPVISAGEDKDVCGQTTQLEGVSGGYSGSWLPNGDIFEDYSNSETEVSVSQYGLRTFIWLETNSAQTISFNCTSKDTVNVTFWQEPTAQILNPASDTSFVCGLTFDNLQAENPGMLINGYWYCQNPAVNYGNVFETNTSATVPYPGYYNFYWIEETGPGLMPGFCNDTAGPVTIGFNVPDAEILTDISDTLISCGLIYSGLEAADPGISNGNWVSNSTFFFPVNGTNINSPSVDIIVYEPTVAEFYWIVQHGPSDLNCRDTAGPAIIRFLSEPTAEIITDMSDTIFNCGHTYYNLQAESPDSQFVGYWDTPNISSIMFGDWNNEETSVTTNVDYFLYNFYWIVQYSDYPSCKDTAGPVKIYFLKEVTSFAGDDNSIFGHDYVLTGEISEFYNPQFPGTIIWENSDAIFTDSQNDTTLVTVPIYDDYDFVLSAYYTDHPDCGNSDTVSILFKNPLYPIVDNVIANIDFSWAIYYPDNDDIMVYLYQELSEKSSLPVYELISQKHPGSNGQAIFEDIEPGIYNMSSSLANSDNFPQLLENVYSGNALIIDNSEAIIKNDGESVFISLNHQLAPDFYGTNTVYGKVGFKDGYIINGVADQVVVLYNSDSDEVLDVSITNELGYYYFSMIPDYTNIEIFVSSFEHPQHTAFSTLTSGSVDLWVNFILDGQLAYPEENNSVDLESQNKIKIFPNPAHDYISILSDKIISSVQIFDINGKLLKSVSDSFDKIDVSDFEQGLYIVVVNANDSVLTGKFVR